MEVKFIVKEVYRHTAACDACKVRKRKCDGVAPCKYCVSKNIKCEFSQQKKRGPSKKPKPEKDNKSTNEPKPATTIINNENMSKSGIVKVSSNSTTSTIGTLSEGDNLAKVALQVARESLATSVIDKEMLNTLELNHYIDLYTRFVTNVVPGCNVQSLISPSSIAHKLQSYAAMAFAARSIGDYTKAKLFISQGRVLAGSIFDNPDLDTVVGMIMMGNYWQMSLNLPLSGHYANLAWSLFKLLRRSDYRVQLCCQVNFIMSDPNTNDEGKSELLLNASRSLRSQGNSSDNLSALLLSLSAKVVPLFGSTMFFPHSMPNIFQIFRQVFITEGERASIMEDLGAIEKIMVRQTFYICAKDAVHPYLLQVKQAIIEWKSGHVDAAFAQALQSWEICKKMQSAKILGVTCDFPHLCLLAGLTDFFKEMGHLGHSLHTCNLLRQICNLMGPDYDFASECVEDFTKVNAINDYEVANHSDNESLSSEASPYGSPSHAGMLDSPKHPTMETIADSVVTSFHSPHSSPLCHPSYGMSPNNSPNTSTGGMNINTYSTNFNNTDINNNNNNTYISNNNNNNNTDGIVFDANELLRFEDDLSFISTENILPNNNNINSINNHNILPLDPNITDELLSFSGNFNAALNTLSESLIPLSTSNNLSLPTTNNNFNNNNNTNHNNPLSNSSLFTNTLNSDSLDAAIGEILNDPSLYPACTPSYTSALPALHNPASLPSFTPPLDNSNNTTTNNVDPSPAFPLDNSFSNFMNDNNSNTNNNNNILNNTNYNNTINTTSSNPQFGFDFGTLNDSGNFFAPPELWDFSSLPPSTPKGLS